MASACDQICSTCSVVCCFYILKPWKRLTSTGIWGAPVLSLPEISWDLLSGAFWSWCVPLDTKVSGLQNSCRYLTLWYCHYSTPRPWFLDPKFLLSLGGWLLRPFSVQFQISTYSPASRHSTASYIPWQIFIPDKILGYYMQHTAIDYQLRSEKLLNSNLLPNYEECMARSHSPELSPTNIFPKCYWHPVQLIITTYVTLYFANW